MNRSDIALDDSVVDIPLPGPADDVGADESVEFEVELLRPATGHFGDTFRRC